MLDFLFPFLLAGSKVRPADTRKNTSLSIPGRFQRQTDGLFISREHISTFVPLLPIGDHLLVNYFSLLNQMDPEESAWGQNSCTAIYNCLTIIFDSQHKGKLKTINKWTHLLYERLLYMNAFIIYFLFFNITRSNRTLQRQKQFPH